MADEESQSKAEPIYATDDPLDPACTKLLFFLSGRTNTLVRIADMAAQMDFDRGKIGLACKELERRGLANRPEGQRNGVCLTGAGSSLAESLLKIRRKIDVDSTQSQS